MNTSKKLITPAADNVKHIAASRRIAKNIAATLV